MQIPADKLHHISLVVHDARASAAKLARMYGIAEWHVVGDSGHLDETVVGGFRSDFGYVTATGTVMTGTGPVTFELVQPTSGWTIYQQWLITRGEGIIGVAVAEIGVEAFASLKPWLAEQGIAIAQSVRVDGVVDRVTLDTRTALGGFYVELLVALEADWRAKVRIDETWDLSGEIPAEGALLPIPAFLHFGVVVTDLMKVVERWNGLFGQTDFLFMNWRKAPGLLTDPENNGVQVDHAYFTTTPTIGERLSFELIQPTFGPSHYKEDFLQPLGEGIHHIFAGFLPDRAAWETIRARMESVDVPVCMGGGLGDDVASFYYLDTRKALPGYVTELVHPGANAPAPDAGFPFTPTMVVRLGDRV